MTDDEPTAKRTKLEKATDTVIGTLKRLNPDDLDEVAKVFWAKAPRTATTFLSALEESRPQDF